VAYECQYAKALLFSSGDGATKFILACIQILYSPTYRHNIYKYPSNILIQRILETLHSHGEAVLCKSSPCVDDSCLLMYFPIKLFSYVVDVM